MKRLKDVNSVKSIDEAQQLAMDYQSWASEQSLSYSELGEFQAYFETLAEKFALTKEFKENGII